MLKARAGFTLGEVMVALVLTAVIGTAVTGVFISQSQFYDVQEKAGSARSVARGAVNILLSDMRMIESGNGVVDANDSMLQVRVPYRMGLICGSSSAGVWGSFLPADSSVLASVSYGGYAYMHSDSTYRYMDGGSPPQPVGGSIALRCATAQVRLLTNGRELRVHPQPVSDIPPVGRVLFLYQNVTYSFAPSVAVPGTRALWRQAGVLPREELVAPFDTTARFRYYVSDAATPTATPTPPYSTITGVHLTLDARSERPGAQGSVTVVPFSTSVFFRNRL